MNAELHTFTSSIRLFPMGDEPPDIERLYIIDGSTVVFDAHIVDTTTITKIDGGDVSVRINLKDGTHVDTIFGITTAGITDR